MSDLWSFASNSVVECFILLGLTQGELVSWHLKHKPKLKKQMVDIHYNLESRKACESRKEVDSLNTNFFS